MSAISGTTPVFLWVIHPQNGQRIWLHKTETVRNRNNDFVLKPIWDDEDRFAKSYQYSVALIVKRRLESEGVSSFAAHDVRFSLTPDGEQIASGSTTSAPTSDNRQIMHYRGVLVRPFNPRGWCVHLYDGPRQLESVKGDTIEDVVEKVFERNLQGKAEKAPTQPAPDPTKAAVTAGPRLRPGDIS